MPYSENASSVVRGARVRRVRGQPIRRWIADAGQDVRYALRQFGRTPAFFTLVILTLSLGIGANATMTAAIDRLLLRAPAHVREPERVVRLLRVASNPMGGQSVSPRMNYPALLDFERDVDAFDAVAGYSSVFVSFGEGAEAVEARATLVSNSFFSLFGVAPHIGRLFLQSDDITTRQAVLGYGFWQLTLGADSAVLGRSIRIGSLNYTVIGVSAPGFKGVDTQPTHVWLPVAVAAERDLGIPLSLEDRGSAWLSIVARLQKGASKRGAEVQASNVWRGHSATEDDHARPRIVAASAILGRGPDRPREVNIALWLAAVSALVLVIACANVANLLLARDVARRREIAVRLAMGASRERLARQLIAEAMLLSALGGAAALYVGALGSRVVQRLLLPDSAVESVLSPRILVITASIALGAAVLVSLAPLLRTTSPDLSRSLRDGEGVTSGRSRWPLLGLLGGQAALCMTLLLLAGLFSQSLRRIHSLDLGLDIDRTLLVKVDLGTTALPRADMQATYDMMLQRVRSIDGVAHAAVAARDPFSYGRAIPAHTPRRSEESLWHHDDIHNVPKEVLIDSGFFRALGTKSLRGRDFDSDDRRGAPRVAIVNQPLARILWPGEEPLGQCMLITFEGGDCVKIVGVVGGFLRRTILDRDELAVYLPMAQTASYVRPGSILIASTGDPATVASKVRRALQSIRPGLPAVSVAPMSQVLRPQFRPWQVAAAMFTIFAVIALVIAVVGLYAVVEFTAAQRSRETAIRVALGAGPREVMLVVAGHALAVVCAGLVVGGLITLGFRAWIGGLLFQTSPSDPRIIAAVGLLLLTVAAVASIVPTLRVLRRSPAATLRMENL